MAVRYLVNRSRCLIDARDRQGDTALHWCATKGNSSIAKLLIESHANPNIQNDHNQTPLDIAIKYKAWGIKRVLVKAMKNSGKNNQNSKFHVDFNPFMRYIAFITPMFLEMAVLYEICTFPLFSYATLFTFLGVILFFYLFGSSILPLHASTTPFTYGHVCGAVFIHLLLYYIYVYSFTADFVILNVLFGILLIPYWYYLLRSHFAKSGYYQGPIINSANISENIQASALRVSNFCVTCLVIIFYFREIFININFFAILKASKTCSIQTLHCL